MVAVVDVWMGFMIHVDSKKLASATVAQWIVTASKLRDFWKSRGSIHTARADCLLYLPNFKKERKLSKVPGTW